MNWISSPLLLTVLLAVPSFANVIISSPRNGDTITSTAKFVATGNTATCAKGVASMGIYLDDHLVYVANGTNLSTSLILTPGKHNAVVQEWDFCGGATLAAVPITVSGQSAVWVTSPVNNTNIGSLTSYVATATTSCATGIAAMGVYVNDQLTYVTNGPKLDTQMTLAAGKQQTVIQEWDNCGGSSSSPINVTVNGGARTFTDIQASKGWYSWGQKSPDYSDCDFPCTGVTWSMAQGTQSPSLTGNATQFNLGGSTPYSDVLFANHLIGEFSSQGLLDRDRQILPNAHNFTYDAYFYVSNAPATQAMEFDINWFADSIGMTWGTECRIGGGHEWDIWDNANAKWLPTGFACNVIENGWNHVTITAQRTPSNTLLYQSITLNGVTNNINRTFVPFTVPSDWYGITVNYQMDGNQNQAALTSYLDKFSFTSW